MKSNLSKKEFLKVKSLVVSLMGSLTLLFLITVQVACNPSDVDYDQKRKSLRAYSGAPPVVPHRIDRRTSRETCLHCHTSGGNYFKGKRAKPTPHPEFINCWQCHVEQKDKSFYVKSDFQPNRYHKYPKPEPEVPPFRPHPLQNREKCETCHLGENADPDLVTPHGPREGCPMCHMDKPTEEESEEDDFEDDDESEDENSDTSKDAPEDGKEKEDSKEDANE